MKVVKLIFVLIVGVLNAQVGINTDNPEPSSMLDIKIDGNRKTVTFPRVHLNSVTDKSVISGGDPAHGLLVYNLNKNLREGKGLYWWDKNYQRWLAIINQESRSYYANLVQYKVSQSTQPIDLTMSGYSGEQLYEKGESINNGWTEIGELEMDFETDKEQNNIRITFTGTIGLSRYFPDESLQDLSIGYGIFIDDKLIEGRADMVLLEASCGYHTFYVNALAQDVEVGKHNVKFAVKKRSRANKQEKNGFVIGGDAEYIYDYDLYNNEVIKKCNKVNLFEAHPSATLHIVQKP